LELAIFIYRSLWRLCCGRIVRGSTFTSLAPSPFFSRSSVTRPVSQKTFSYDFLLHEATAKALPSSIISPFVWLYTFRFFHHSFLQYQERVTDSVSSRPQNYMFKLMRDALGIDKSVDILDHCHSLPPAEEAAALEKIRAIEKEAMISQELQPGIIPLMEYIDSFNIPKAICTRNFDLPVNHLLTKFLPTFEFSPSTSKPYLPRPLQV